MIEYGGIVNIVTLVVFFIYLCLSLYLVVRQGLGHNYAWICLSVLSLCRLTQVALDLAATELFPPKTAPNTTLESGVAILTELGLTPLFMSTASLLNMTSRPKGRRMQWILILLHIPLLASLILIVAGGIDPDSREGPTFASTEATKAGVALYCACFVVLVWATIVISSRLYLADPLEVKILTTVVLSMPFFVVDIVYMMCFAFEGLYGSQRFNVISGDVTLQLCMQVTMEVARLREVVTDHDYEQLAGTFLWKAYEKSSAIIAVTVLPALKFAHWLLGRILRP
ncbi:hypothetical protein CC78DRAFT_208565 [Lojkania enalia]|uniref:DUF7702 domain-containing protein n=1 Tax=Lojkania enalia TaxID=147567 RepID=A0A9P4N6U9_9PLEO|nr:hypothetical protein CC78DRAFT_208565 [Didymosphaeria enalia]